MKQTLISLGKNGGKNTISSNDILTEDIGFILRTGFAGLNFVSAINDKKDGSYAVLHGSMVEMSILQKSQNAGDLLANKKPCFVDKYHHLEGAKHLPLLDTRSLVELAAAVETRLTRGEYFKRRSGTRMEHCSSDLYSAFLFQTYFIVFVTISSI